MKTMALFWFNGLGFDMLGDNAEEIILKKWSTVLFEFNNEKIKNNTCLKKLKVRRRFIKMHLKMVKSQVNPFGCSLADPWKFSNQNSGKKEKRSQ